MASGSAVNKPTNIKQKEQDVNNKLQLYGIYSAFANGKVPSNKQADIAMNSFLESKALTSPSKKLSAEGQALVADVRDVIEKAKQLILTKNDGNLIQDFIWQTQQITGGSSKDAKLNAPVDKDTAKQHGNEALEGLRTLGTLLISNGQFRKLLNDATILLRDIAGDAATKAASKVNPSDDQLAQIDQAAEENTWHDVPDMSKDALKSRATDSWNANKPFSKGDVKTAAGDAAETAHPDGVRDPVAAGTLAAQDQREGINTGSNPVGGASAGIDTLKQTADQNIPDDKKDKAKEYRERTKSYMQTKMPKERREQTIWRLKMMVIEIQRHQDYQRAIDTLLRLAEEYTGHSKNLVGQGTSTVKGAHTDDALTNAEADLKTIIERFANSTSTDDLFDAINQIYRDADQDPELRQWFKSIDAYIRRCLKEEGFIMQDASNDQWNALYDQGNYLLRNKYKNHTDRIVDEIKFLADQFDRDPQNKAFALAMNKLFTDLGNDENGKSTFKPHLLKDVTEVILPEVLENIRYVPIPRIEYSDPNIDAIVENLVIESDNLTPNVLEFGSDNFWRWGRKKIASKNKNKVMLSVSGVQMDLRDVAFYVKRKQGFPSITDKGVADLFMGGAGLSFKVQMETADDSDKAHFFKIGKVDVDIKNLNIKVKQSSHKILFAIAKPILLKAIRPGVQKAIEKQIKDSVHQLDGIAFEIHREVQKAEADAKANPDPENVQNIYNRYWNAIQQRYLQAKEKKDSVVSDKKVNMAMTKNDSMFKNISLPGGISTKATEYKELAAKGDKWESPVFSLGSAKESLNIPKPTEITRKPHSANLGGVRNTGGASLDAPQGTGTANFSNQVSNAFDDRGKDYSLSGTAPNGAPVEVIPVQPVAALPAVNGGAI